MKKAYALLLVFVMLATSVPVVTAQTKKFSDVTSDKEYYRAVTYLTEKGIVEGKSETEFCPEDSLKREEFAKITAKAFELQEKAADGKFTDVATDGWYVPYVNAVNASGLMTGISENEFGVGMSISRQDLAVVLKRFADSRGITLTRGYTVNYADNDEIADYAEDAVASLSACRAMGIISDGKFLPKENASRADAMFALYMILLEAMPKDHIDEMAPVKVYDPAVMPKVEILYEDFEDDDYGGLIFTEFHDHKEPIVRSSEVGYKSSGSATLTDSGFPCLALKTDEVYPGDVLELSYMVRGENIEGEGQYRALIQAFDDEKTWLWESFEGALKTDTDWKQGFATMTVPDIGNDLNPPEFYYITLCPYMNNLKGTVYFDDFRLTKVIFDPMETVLMTPNYKGLIYGENGVGDISLRAYVNEMSGAYDLSQMNFTSQIIDTDKNVLMESVSETVTPVMDVYFSSANLKMGGDYYLQSILTDKASGELIQKQGWSLRKREEDFRPETSVDEYGRVIINGKPELPMYIYNTGGGTGNYPKCAEAIADVSGHNVDAILEAGFGRWDVYFADEDSDITKGWRANFDAATPEGIKFVSSAGGVGVSKYHRGGRTQGMNHTEEVRPPLEKMINFVKEMPEVSAYYMFDEVDGTKFGEEFRWGNEVFASLDLDHPTINAICDLQPNRPGVYAKTSDFLGTDPYPVKGEEDDDLSKIYKDLTKLKELNPNRPCYIIAQGFAWKKRGDLRPPTKEEFRNMLFQSLAAGTCMINTYAYNDLKAGFPDTWEESWNDYMAVYDEIGEIEDIYLSVLPAPYYKLDGEYSWLNHFTRRYDGKSYLFVINNQKAENEARIHLDGVKEIKGKYSGKTLTADSDGWFTIPFDSLETEIYEYAQEDYKSSHAELKYFGLMEADGSALVLTDSVGEKPCFVYSGEEKELTYSVKVSDFAKVYINGKEAEPEGTVSVEGLDSVTVKVVSEDGRFSAEKTYLVEKEG